MYEENKKTFLSPSIIVFLRVCAFDKRMENDLKHYVVEGTIRGKLDFKQKVNHILGTKGYQHERFLDFLSLIKIHLIPKCKVVESEETIG